MAASKDENPGSASLNQPVPKPADVELPEEIASEELFAGKKVISIRHAGELYRLMITKNDRLILQK